MSAARFTGDKDSGRVDRNASPSERRSLTATRMPEGDDLQVLVTYAVVGEIPNPRKVQPANQVGAGSLHLGADARFLNQQGQGGLEIFAYSSGRGGAVFRPPGCSTFDFPLSAGLDPDDEGQGQPKRRRRASSSSGDMPSSRSASSRAWRSSASCSGGRRTAVASPRARTVTTVPSGSVSPSTTTLPSTTVPEATCMEQCYTRRMRLERRRRRVKRSNLQGDR